MKRCPVCQRRYSEATQFCTRDGTPLSDNDLSSRVVNHCKLCNKFYPQADGICPVHGIPIAEELFEPEQNAPQTREIERTQQTLITSMRVLGFNSDDRRLVTTLATLTVLLLLSLGIYSLTRPAKPEHSGSYETPSNTPLLEDGDRQRIELAGSPSAGVEPDAPLTKTSKPSVTAQAQREDKREKSVSKNATASRTNDSTARSANQTTTETPPTAPQTVPPPTASSAQSASVTDRASVETAPPSPKKPSYSKATNSHPRARITGKTRREIENGYVYEFDLVINGGTGIKWHSVSGSKVTYGGRSTPIRTAQLEPTQDGSLRYHVSVKMTGRSVEDWYGQVYTTTIGTDEEGRTVRIEQDIFLDDSFPIVRQVTRY